MCDGQASGRLATGPDMAYFCKMGHADKKGRKQVIAPVQCHARRRDVCKLTKPPLRKTGVNWKVAIFSWPPQRKLHKSLTFLFCLFGVCVCVRVSLSHRDGDVLTTKKNQTKKKLTILQWYIGHAYCDHNTGLLISHYMSLNEVSVKS